MLPRARPRLQRHPATTEPTAALRRRPFPAERVGDGRAPRPADDVRFRIRKTRPDRSPRSVSARTPRNPNPSLLHDPTPGPLLPLPMRPAGGGVDPLGPATGVMHDLCARQEESADGAMENPAGGAEAEQRGPAAADPAGPPRASVLGKRHHSLYEGLNGCEAGGFAR
ncbi:hypothetical protein ANANG_G00161820 [Anguilla anguilla]|uniref:Uncharacterized protein n=1 Tax=Anguilla anguilla TaxID=7936 RepID=A0A9D3MEJ8_ANGAN|nr:hypothetical protein ANANG_G00161820 [Anguilla anguilla]